MPRTRRKLRLSGFNNLTKTLSFNIYDICYADTPEHKHEYIAYIDEVYNARRLTQILANVADIVGANILNVARQDYDPQGASVTMLICEEPVEDPADRALLPETVVAHLDKSHISVHTYPESHPDREISTFRVDIDVSTCGRISPLKALNHLIASFYSDIVIIDYRVRGFTRDVAGKKFFIDHKIASIQNFIAHETLQDYQTVDVNVYQENIFHTKMIAKHFNLNDYLFGIGAHAFDEGQRDRITKLIRREMLEIFYGRNMGRDSPL